MKCDWTRGRTITALVYTQTEVKHREKGQKHRVKHAETK